MARSSDAGVTLLVLVSMAIPDLVCGGQESGKDSRLTHTHFTPHQYYTPQTGGVKSMTFQTPPRNEMLEENQYGVKSSESGNKPDAAILNSDQPQAERSRDNECNDVKCSDYGSDGTSPNGVELNRVAWDKVSGNTQIPTEGPAKLTHSEGPMDLTHSEGPMDLTHSEGPMDLTHSEGPMDLTHSEGPMDLTHSEGPVKLTHSEGLVKLTHSEGPVKLTHSEGPMDLTHSEGSLDLTHSEGPLVLTHSEGPMDLTHSEGPVKLTHSEGLVKLTHSEGPVKLTHSEGPMDLTHSEGSLDLTHSEGPLVLTHSEGPLVLTHSGAVRGLTLDEAHVFYGIPYAAPPVGPKRWAAPEPVSQWVKPYDATFPRPACMQECAREFSDACLHEVSEDCLYLNLYVPLSVDLSLRVPTRLPVMVWIHGGDFIAGSASKPLYDGRFISNYSNTLVVNMQYRLGAFGFLVTGRDPERAAVGNYGILDQQAALRWVRENIAAFGGDPTKVTLFAESAGAQSVCLHLMMRSSESLFRHATIQSQPFSIPLKSRWEAMKLGRNFVKQTNCSASDLQCLRLLSTHTVLQAQVQAGSKLINPFRFLEMFETWGPHVDGGLITEQPIAAFLQGRWQSYKPVIVGTTSEEGVSFVYGSFNSSVSALEFVLYITAIFKQHTLEVLQKYLPVYREQDRWTMLSQIVTDFMFLCPARRVARSAPRVGGDAWVYVFDHAPSDHKIWEGLTCCYRHACHGAELPFLFDSAPAANFSFTARETLLANQMVCYWGAFAHSGDPNSHGEHTPFCRNQRLAPWPKYTPAERWPVLNLTLQSHLQHQNRDGFCDFWDRLDIY